MNSIIQTALLVGLALPGFSQAPPVAPAPPAPVVAPLPPLPPSSSDVLVAPEPPEPPMILEMPDIDLDMNFNFDFHDMEVLKPEIAMQMTMAQEKMHELQSKMDLVTRPEINAQMELAREKMDSIKDQLFLAQNMVAGPKPMPMPGMKFNFDRDRGRRDSDEGMYRRGAEYLDQRQWDKAIEAFDQVIERKGNKADGAYYWKGYAFSKQGQATQALATLAELYKAYPNSRWLNDAKALEVEVRQSKGQAVSPEGENDEDLKLLAINGLVGNDPDRVVPLLDKILQNRNSPKVKERALFVLAQSKTPQAREIVVKFAKGSGNPDLQTKAVEYLGIFGGKDSLQILSDVYGSTNDLALRRSILHSFLRAGDKDRLLSAAKNEQNPELRIEAIHLLGSMGAQNRAEPVVRHRKLPGSQGGDPR